jgi:hypothetical protein
LAGEEGVRGDSSIARKAFGVTVELQFHAFDAVPVVASEVGRRYYFIMSIQEIEKVIQGMSRQEVEELQGWIQDFLEDERELTDGFKASIERGRRDVAEGRVRVRQS